MTCPNCQNICGEADGFCFRCGTPLLDEASKRGTHRVPILILILLSIIGIVLFFAIPLGSPISSSETPWFVIQDGELFFNASLYSGSNELVVPETVNGQTVTAIGQAAFAGCPQLTTVILPDSVQTIGALAFAECTSLRGIYLPEGVAAIGPQAFSDCSALEAIGIPSTAESIGSNAFEDCAKLFYIFYNGEFLQWKALYSGYITPYTQVSCTDGVYLQP